MHHQSKFDDLTILHTTAIIMMKTLYRNFTPHTLFMHVFGSNFKKHRINEISKLDREEINSVIKNTVSILQSQ